jgi:hypothetical protein
MDKYSFHERVNGGGIWVIGPAKYLIFGGLTSLTFEHTLVLYLCLPRVGRNGRCY